MIDLHTHILPGVDDGSECLEESLEMAELALEGGTGTLVVTPHSNQTGRFENYHSELLMEQFRKLEEAVKKRNLPLKLYRGMEIYASWDVAEKIADGRLIGLGSSDYYLVEFPFDMEADDMGDILESFLNLGKIPLIAHPERYACIQHNPGIVYEWMRIGCLSQINKGSLFGRFGNRAAKAAEILMDFQLVTCIASDAHSSVMRTPYLGDIREAVAEQYGQEYAQRLLFENPKAILGNDEITFEGSPPVRRYRIFR